MTNPSAMDPALLDRISRQCAALARDFDRFGADLYALSIAVETPAAIAHSVPPTTTAPPVPPTAAAALDRDAEPLMSPSSAPPRVAAPVLAGPESVSTPPPSEPSPAPAHDSPAPTVGWWQRDSWVSRALALAGVAITLVGVVMLLVLAAQAGLLRPEVRVAMGAVLAGALVATGFRVSSRPGGRVGGVALASTGFAAAYLDVVAVTSGYHWVAPPVGLALAGAVATAGIVTAMRWRSVALALIVNVACVLTAPALTDGITFGLVLFYVVFQLVGSAPELLRGWSPLAAVRTSPVVLTLLYIVAEESWRGVGAAGPSGRSQALAVAVAVIGLGVGVWGCRVQRTPEVAALFAGLAAVPLIAAAALSERPASIMFGLGLAAACWATLALTSRDAYPIRVVLASVGGLGLLVASIAVPTADPVLRAAPFLVVAVVSGALATQTHARFVQAYAAVFGFLGLSVTLAEIRPRTLADQADALRILGPGAVLVGLLLLVATVLATLVAHREGLTGRWTGVVVVVTVAAGLYAATIVCVATPVAVGGGELSFRVGHFVATTVWMLTGCGVLVLGLARPAYARVFLAAGLTVVAAALAKLVTYDLSAMTGFTRAATFLVTGVLLLVAGTRYARAFAEREGARSVSA